MDYYKSSQRVFLSSEAEGHDETSVISFAAPKKEHYLPMEIPWPGELVM